LWDGYRVPLPGGSDLRRPDPEGREAERNADRAADEAPPVDQSTHCQCAWADDPTGLAVARQRSDRLELQGRELLQRLAIGNALPEIAAARVAHPLDALGRRELDFPQ